MRRVQRRRLGPAAWLALTLLALGAGAEEAPPPALVPWPLGAAPSPSELADAVAAADQLYQLERAEEFLEAVERGEDREHILVFQEDIDAGSYDLELLFTRGDALFEHEFRREDGYGGFGARRIARVHNGVRGGLDSFSCAGCHSVGGLDGAGAPTQNAFVHGDGVHLSSSDVRNPPHTLGLGLVQALAAEMSHSLGAQRDQALLDAATSGRGVTVALSAKGVEFGSLTASPIGQLDLSAVRGVSSDLIVRPFGWKGDVARLRRFVEEAARVHFGVQAHTLALLGKDQPDPDKLGSGPWFDPDGDGKQRELEEGTITAGAVYLALLEVPVMLPPHDPSLRTEWSRGSALFDELGCESCHVRTLRLDYSYWDELPDTTGGAGVRMNLLSDGEAPRGSSLVELFSDLRRHDMGPELADRNDHELGIARSEFLTRPLWGLAESAPFLHDGRAPTLNDAIALHGGEASESRDAYLALPPDERGALATFLLSLTRTPRLRSPR